MALTIFSAFRSTVTSFSERLIKSTDRWLTDPVTGAITGVQNQNAVGPDARFVPVDITLAQQTSPTAAMLADLDAVYRLNVAPYTRFTSTGMALAPLAGALAPDGTTLPGATLQTVPPGTPGLVIGVDSYDNVYSPFTVQNAAGVTVQGSLYVTTRPA